MPGEVRRVNAELRHGSGRHRVRADEGLDEVGEVLGGLLRGLPVLRHGRDSTADLIKTNLRRRRDRDHSGHAAREVRHRGFRGT